MDVWYYGVGANDSGGDVGMVMFHDRFWSTDDYGGCVLSVVEVGVCQWNRE